MATKTSKIKETEVKATKATKATAEKKTVAKKTAANKNEVFVQFAGFEFSHDEMLEKVKADYTAKTGKKRVTSTKLYVKVDDMKIYYVVNDKFMSDVSLD